MRFVVYGAGAIGGVVGARLHQAGHEVVLIARGPHLEAIRQDGLTIEDPDAAATLPIEAVGHPAEVDLTSDDVVLLAVKGQHAPDALAALVAAAPHELAVVCMQNGLDGERQALRHFAATYGMNVQCPASHLEPGVVQASSAPTTGLLDLGCYPEGVDARAGSIAAALERSTFRSEPRPDIVRWKRRKLLLNLGNAVEALCGRGGAGGELAARARAEGEACFAAAGHPVATAEEDRARRADHLQVRPIGGRERGGGSSWQSLARGTGSIEADHLNGEIVLLGRLHDVPTPANALLQHLARQAAAEHRPPGSFDADDLLARLDAPGR